MNERIKELAEQATIKIAYRIDPHTFYCTDDPSGPHIRLEFDKEKFAELIVRECAQISEEYAYSGTLPMLISYLIKKRFGVKDNE